MDARIGKQGGWVGMVALLLALVIVAYLAKDALKKYGLVPDAETTMQRAGSPAAGAVERTDASAATPAPASVLDKARSVEGLLKEQSEKRGGN